jgi:DNA replication protein DnaC
VNAKIRKAGFPFIKTFEEFDFSYQPKLDEKLLRELAILNFLTKGENILFIGPPGVGKTHLAIAFGVECVKQRWRVFFYTAENLINEMIAAEVSNTLHSSSLFFRMVSKRYERASIIITSNKPFEEWGKIFNDDVVAAAILDRLLHHSHPFLIQGKSYRTREIFGKNHKSFIQEKYLWRY